MKPFVAAAAAAFSISMAPAVGQSLGDASVRFYNSCMSFAAQTDPGLDASRTCACGAGFFGGALTDRQVEIASRITMIAAYPEGPAQDAAASAIVQGLIAEGYSQDEIIAVSGMIESLSSRADAVCKRFEIRKGSV